MNIFRVDHFDQSFDHCSNYSSQDATLKQILDSLHYLNFHKTSPNFKPMPHIVAQHHLEHNHAAICPKLHTREVIALEMKSTHKVKMGYNSL
jgi:hypothetical protein